MKALMFGWEFPPHILGGLGTASYGLIKGMSRHKDIDITLVLPKPRGALEPAYAQKKHESHDDDSHHEIEADGHPAIESEVEHLHE